MSPQPRSRVSLSFRLGVTAAAAVLLTSGCLTPLVQGTRWFLDVAVAVAAVTVAGLVVRELVRWRLPVVLAQLAALAIVVTTLFARESAVAGVLPSPAVWSRLRVLADQGMEITREQSPPVDAKPGVLLLVVAGIGLIAVLTDATAATWRRPALAGLPLLAVYCVPAAVLADGLAWPWFLLAACGFLLLVASESGDRVRSWGRMVNAGSQAPGDRVRLGVLPGSSGMRAAGVALVAALTVPLALPALGDPLIDGSGLGDGKGSGKGRGRYVNPILDLRKNLTERSDDVALRMRLETSKTPPMLRIATDEKFDGTTWSPNTEVPPRGNQASNGLPEPIGLGSDIATTRQRLSIEVGSLDQSFLPLPYPTTDVDIEGDWRFNSATLDVLGRGVRTAGQRYGVEYLEVNPTSQQLLDFGTADTIALRPFLELPSYPKIIRDEAERVAGNGTSLSKAYNLQTWFRESFQYSTAAPAPGNGRNDASLDVMVEFLRKKQGYCVHFASAMAVMARMVGIPSRVAVGFLPPTANEDGVYEVTYARAHAWPELYFRGAGWQRFEPTPPTQSGQPPGWTLLNSDQAPNPQVPAVTTSRPGATGSVSAAPQERPQASTPLGARSAWRPTPWLLTLLLLPVLAAAPRLVAAGRRRRRWGRARGAVDLAETAWSSLQAALADLGSSWPVSATPRQVRRLLVDRHDLSVTEEAPLGRLVADLEAARYAPPEAGASSGEVRRRRQDVEEVRRAVASRLPRSRRLRAAWWPSWRTEAAPAVQADLPVDDRVRVPAGSGSRGV
ncbi:MAG: DUF3488 and transglutaminase-like domain-containing protein [Kineosporiaceae bacterium]